MINQNLILPVCAAFVIAACGQTANGQSETAAPTNLTKDADQSAFAAVSGDYVTEPNHRYISFSYLHQGFSRPQLRWRDWAATLHWNAENPENSSVEVVIDVASIDSGVDEFDERLRDEKFFDVVNYPEIKFVSTGISKIRDDAGKMAGDLTIKDVTKPVTLDVKFNKDAFDDRSGVYKLGFSGKATVKRSDFGVGLYVPYVGDDVDIVIEAEFVMAAE